MRTALRSLSPEEPRVRRERENLVALPLAKNLKGAQDHTQNPEIPRPKDVGNAGTGGLGTKGEEGKSP